MDFLIYIGGAFTLTGLIGLGYCIKMAVAIKREGSEAKDASKRLRTLVAWNMGAMGMSSIGLAMIVIGLIL